MVWQRNICSVKHIVSVLESTILLRSIEVEWFGMLLLVLSSHFVEKGSFRLFGISKKLLFSEFQAYQKPPEVYRKTAMKDITLPTRDCIREC